MTTTLKEVLYSQLICTDLQNYKFTFHVINKVLKLSQLYQIWVFLTPDYVTVPVILYDLHNNNCVDNRQYT